MTTVPLDGAKHGTTTGYARGCRCTGCRAAKRLAGKRYRDSLGRQSIGNPCQTPDGRVFPSQAAAARALGVSKSAVSAQLERYGNLSNLGKRPLGRPYGGKKPVKVGSREWPSRSALARYLGRHDNCVRDWLKRGRADLLIAALMKADAQMAAEQARSAA